jgi:hypothetical protein
VGRSPEWSAGVFGKRPVDRGHRPLRNSIGELNLVRRLDHGGGADAGSGRRGKDGPERGKGRSGSQVDAAVMAQEVGRPPFRRRFPVL